MRFLAIFLLAVVIGITGPAWAETPGQGAPKVRLYGNNACPSTGAAVNPSDFTDVHLEGTNIYGRIYLCCPGCESSVRKDPKGSYKKAFMTTPEGKVKAVRDLHNQKDPVNGAPVSASEEITFNGMRLAFSSKETIATFLKDPNKYLAELLPEEGWYTPSKGPMKMPPEKPDAGHAHH